MRNKATENIQDKALNNISWCHFWRQHTGAQEPAGMTQEHISYVPKNLWFCHGDYFLWNRWIKWAMSCHSSSVFFIKYMESIQLKFQPLLKQSTSFSSFIQIAVKLKGLGFFLNCVDTVSKGIKAWRWAYANIEKLIQCEKQKCDPLVHSKWIDSHI